MVDGIFVILICVFTAAAMYADRDVFSG